MQKQLVTIYAYVVMPNHIHLVWKVNAQNGKESPQGSFLKFTAHRFRKTMLESSPHLLKDFEVNAVNKSHEFWQRDSLATPLWNRAVILQKINYIHNNPMAKHWRLAATPEEYRFSSASFYEKGTDEFKILTHIGDIW
ncbi:MAG TPA: hypothetical protein VLC98_04050 [Phnomibacter sp.]|nr:hypothetical protein [Phnomibacter sp.]